MMQWIHGWLAGWAWRLSHLPQARGAWLVVVLILGIHGLVEAAGGVQHAAQWYLTFGLRRTEVATGALWQLGSYALLHGSWLHVLGNALCVLVLGSRVEYLLGLPGLFKTLAAGVIGGAVGHLVLADGGAGAAPLVGISGACVALLLVLTTLSPDSRMWPIPVSGRSLGRGILLGELIFALINPQLHLPGFFRLGEALVRHGFESWFAVGHACHLAGGVAGWLVARAVLRPRVDLETLRQRRRHREASARGGKSYR
jgi:membrane associated rhomboid family serine protease